MKKLLIYARHPIFYQVPIFKELSKFNIDLLVAYGSDISLNEIYFDEINVIFKPDTPNLLNGYNYIFFKNYGVEKYPFLSRINFSIFPYIFKEKYDYILIHGYDNFTSILLLFFSKILNIKTIWRGEVIGDLNFKKKLFLKFLFLFIDYPLYSCEGNKRFIESVISKPLEKKYKINCSVDNQYFINEVNKYGYWNNETFTIIFSARFTKRKRPKDLLDACNNLGRKYLRIIWIGDGPELENIKILSKNSIFTNEFVGFVNQSELGRYYSQGNIAVIPSFYDPSPKVVNELLNFNVISIMSNQVGTSSDLVFDLNDIFDVGNVNHLASRIEFYYDNFDSQRENIITFSKTKLSLYNPLQNAQCIYDICQNKS